MAIVYSYFRFSRPEQKKGDSKRRQVEKAMAWIEKEGHILDTTLKMNDEGVSAFRGKNQSSERGLGQFLEAIQDGRVQAGSILAVENLDRLSRESYDDASQLIRSILKAGVCIKTFIPDELLTIDDLNNPFKVISVLMVLVRANEESEVKSKRLRETWIQKRDTIHPSMKLTSICPAWILANVIKSNKTIISRTFEIIPDRVDLVQRIFQMANEGMGAVKIARTLNQEGIPTFDTRKNRASCWSISYIKKIIHNRAVLGEYQPCLMENGKRVPIGEVIRDYFPSIIQPSLFYAVQDSMEKRSTQRGRHGKKLTNLFTGLLFDARDNAPLTITNKGYGPSLVSSAAIVGKEESIYMTFPYENFEKAMLVWGSDLNLGDVLPRKRTDIQKMIEQLEGEIKEEEHRIKTTREKLKEAKGGQVSIMLDIILQAESSREEMQDRLERLKREQATPETEALNRTKELIGKLQGASDEEVYLLRLKLRGYLKRLIQDICFLAIEINGEKIALVDVKLENGKRMKRIEIRTGNPLEFDIPFELQGDIREYKKWPKRSKHPRWTVETMTQNRMIELEMDGFSRTDIANHLGMTVSQVSREMRKAGYSKQEKKVDKRFQMTFHPGGSGWVKCYRKERYFVGFGTLKNTYPKLFKGKDAEGSYLAANSWWEAKKAEIDGE